jgi:hypothetical protein
MKLLSNFNSLPNIKKVCLLLQNSTAMQNTIMQSMDQKETMYQGVDWIHQADGRVMW